MKNNVLIVMNYLHPGACIAVDRVTWTLTHVTTPRPSCLDALQRRNTLREMYPQDTRKINGHIVRKSGKVYVATRYIIDGKYYTFADALAVIEAEPPPMDARETDNVLALVEVLSNRNPARQVSRDMYVYELQCDIADALEAASTTPP